ncbi:MAG: NAD(P)H-dependent oxidoreductase [Candidatus Omnitrophica bacterium]|nr:NAD(P)H-dependent oxidoreductase [Candidatus Omnitrophota bacterium]
MKIAVVFYSFSGNTKRLASFLKEKFLEKKREVDLIELKPVREETVFLKQCMQAFLKRKPELLDVQCDLKNYELVIFSSPVWAFTFAPCLHSYFKKVKNLEGKQTVIILTYGSGAGADKALKEMEEVILGFKTKIIFEAKIPGYKTKNEDYLAEKLEPLIEMV